MTIRREACLSIAGFDPSGGAGLIADIKTFTQFGCHAAAVLTSTTFQNSFGVNGFAHQTAESICAQMLAIFEEFEIKSVKIGMLPTASIVSEVARNLRSRDVPNIVLDPVIRSTSGSALIDEKALEVMKAELFPITVLLTPNVPEAEHLTGITIETEDDLNAAAEKIQDLGAKNVLLKGGHFEKDSARARDFLFIGGKRSVFEAERISNDSVRGTGCRLSSAIAANLALGTSLDEAVKIAKEYVRSVIVSVAQATKSSTAL